MSLKIKLISMLSGFVLLLSMLVIGVIAASNQTINLKGNVEFSLTDSSLYVKDIRLMNSITGGNTLENFVPGFVNEGFDLNIGDVSSTTGSITLQLDLVNTTSTKYIASTKSTLTNAAISVSGEIAGDEVPLADVSTYEGVSGTVTITITLASGTSANINLDNIVIDLEEYKTVGNVSLDIQYNYSSNIIDFYYSINDSEEMIPITEIGTLQLDSIDNITFYVKNGSMRGNTVTFTFEPEIYSETILDSDEGASGYNEVTFDITQDIIINVYVLMG